MTDPTPRAYRSPEVTDLTGATPRQLTYWVDQGVIAPSIAFQRGTGSRHLWSTTDLRLVKVLAELVALGCDIRTLRQVPELLAQHAGEGWLLAGPGRVRLCTASDLADALTRDEPAWHVVRLTTILHDLPTDNAAAAV